MTIYNTENEEKGLHTFREEKQTVTGLNEECLQNSEEKLISHLEFRINY